MLATTAKALTMEEKAGPIIAETATPTAVPIKLPAIACDPDFAVISAKLSFFANDKLIEALAADADSQEIFFPILAIDASGINSLGNKGVNISISVDVTNAICYNPSHNNVNDFLSIGNYKYI